MHSESHTTVCNAFCESHATVYNAFWEVIQQFAMHFGIVTQQLGNGRQEEAYTLPQPDQR